MPRFEKDDHFFEIYLKNNRVITRSGKSSWVLLKPKVFSNNQKAKEYYDQIFTDQRKFFYDYKAVKPQSTLPPFIKLPRYAELEHTLQQEVESIEAWLVYADWLQTQGDERGELLFMGLHRKTVAEDKKALFVARLAELKESFIQWFEPSLAHALLYEGIFINMGWWHSFLSGFVKKIDWHWEYGEQFADGLLGAFLQASPMTFLQSLTLHWKKTNNSVAIPLQAIAEASPCLHHVTLKGVMRLEPASCYNIKYLVIDIFQLKGLQKSACYNLESLEIRFKDIDKKMTLQLTAEKFPKLKYLTLFSINNHFFEFLYESPLLAQIIHLKITGAVAYKSTPKVIALLNKMPKLQILEIEGLTESYLQEIKQATENKINIIGIP